MPPDFHYLCIFLDLCLALLLVVTVYHIGKIAYRLADGIYLFLGDYERKSKQVEEALKDSLSPND